MITWKVMKEANPDLPIKGMFVGNGVGEMTSDGFQKSQIEFYVEHNMIE